MTPERYQQIKQIFLDSLDRSEPEREGYIKTRCAGDQELLLEVMDLLHHHADIDPSVVERELRRSKTRTTLGEPGGVKSGTAGSAGAGVGGVGSVGGGTAMGQGADAPPPSAPASPKTPDAMPVGGGGGGGGVGGATPSRSRSSLKIDRGQFAPGTVVAERYRIIDLIARGGMGEVYRADDLKLSEPVAMKFLPRRLAGDKRWLERFLEEIRVARTVSHPNVCRVYDLGEDLGEQFLTMEYVQGETLSSLQSRIGRLPTRKAEQIAQQLCGGLAAIHDLGILHRDLKPSNVLIDERGQVKLTDFGLAATGEIKGFQSASGTPGYVAPESLKGIEATVRSDIYQLGLLLFELFTGRAAFVAGKDEDILQVQQRTEPPAPSTIALDIKPRVEQVIQQCLSTDPSARPASARQVAAMLPGSDPLALALEAGETPSPSMVAMAGTRGKIRPGTAAALVLGFLVFTALAMVLGSRGASLMQIALLEKPPAVLADDAHDILAIAGYDLSTTERGDEAWALNFYSGLIDEIDRTDTGPHRWERLRRERPPAVGFWYRWSPEPLGTNRPTGRIAFNDPPQTVPGMIGVRLTTRGKLREIVVVDRRTNLQIDATSGLPSQQPGPPAPPPDWERLFKTAGLELSKFKEESPERIPSVYAETRYAWSGVYPESPETRVRVEAATLGGKLVAFRTVEQDLPGAQSRTRPPENPWKRAGTWLSQIVLALTLIGAAALAWQNTRAKRGDRAGANRAAAVLGPACFLMMVLQADTLQYMDVPLGNLGWMLAVAITAAVAVWVLYVAIEPYVRRIWPESIISWTRLIQGRFTDPLVGQSVLVGSGIGSFALCLLYVNRLIPGWMGLPPSRPFIDLRLGVGILGGTRYACGHMIECVLLGVQTAMMMLVGVVLIKLLVRRTWAALAMFTVVQCAAIVFVSPVFNTNWSWSIAAIAFVFALVVTAIALTTLVRYGVLSLMAAATAFTALGSLPITFQVERWYAGLGLFGLVVVCAIPLYGAFTASLGRTR